MDPLLSSHHLARAIHLIARQTSGSTVPGTNLTVEQYCNLVDATSPKPYDLPGYDPARDLCNPYRYIPSEAWGWISVALFGITTILHLYQTIASRRWWLFNWVAGGFLETLGWVGRGIGHSDPYSRNAFIIQICCLVIAPAFFSAAIYGLLGWAITALSPRHSLIKPHRYWMVFISGDIASLVIQGIGGGVASAGSNQNDPKKLKTGSNIMLAGIIIQLAVMIIFCGFALHFWYGFKRSNLRQYVKRTRGLEKIHYLGYGLVVGSAVIILRGIYRVVELAEGWRGHLMLHEFFFLLDMLPCIICLLTFNIVAPLYTLPRGYPTANDLAQQAGEPLPYPPKEEDGEMKRDSGSDQGTRVGGTDDWKDDKGHKEKESE
ncbi:RTA1-domain-containing protein [Atractiella rhizophila]|nr:RTA1-domain-containing protein [Atractiella rhizophila]